MKITTKIIEFETKARVEFIDVTSHVQELVHQAGVREGQVTIFVRHSTMGVGINHNEPLLLQDLTRILYKIAPVDDQYSHDMFELKKNTKSDGRSNGHSHCKSFFMGASCTVPFSAGELMLGPRQSIFAVEFDGSRKRDVVIQVLGE